MNGLQSERPVGTPSFLWVQQYVERTRLEGHRVDRDRILKAFDAVPYGLRPEYLRQRDERLRKYIQTNTGVL
jgi:hypothetical protein